MVNFATLFVVILCLVLRVTSVEADEKRRVYVVYLGETKHDKPEHTVHSHHEMLASVVGSKKLASELTIYNYKHGFSGFAAKLTESHVQKIREHPDVVHVIPNKLYTVQTTRSWDYLGVGSSFPTDFPTKGNMGDGMIIGVFDSGIWPESKSFNDEGIGAIPSHWKGKCVSGQEFNATEHCNNKIIGAQYFMDGVLHDEYVNQTAFKATEYFSPRDKSGHGTHVASIAAGSYVGGNTSYKGLAAGTVRGGAPKARIAVYKVAWRADPQFPSSISSFADVIKAMDVAIHDGVDLIQMSLAAAEPPIWPDLLDKSTIQETVATIHAVAKGIPIVYGGGNSGPEAHCIDHIEPWVVTVAASTIDRCFLSPITLGNNKTIMAHAISEGNDTGFIGLFFSTDYPSCTDYSEMGNLTLAGKVVLCFLSRKSSTEDPSYLASLHLLIAAGVRGLIVAKKPSDGAKPSPASFRYVEVDYTVGTEILLYTQSTSSPTVNMRSTRTVVGGKYASTHIADFSSRGPNPVAPAILKPDIAAPGVDILAAIGEGFGFKSGTSMSAPHVSGALILLKQSHPDWSPAALKSAIMTTAWNTNQYGLPIFAGGETEKIADSFDMGAGILNPTGAFDPGLVYDMDMNDYVHYFCAMGYDNAAISKVANLSNPCPEKQPSILDVNLPSITIPDLAKPTTIKRTVTNVGPENSSYEAVIQPPTGTVVSVKPNVLVFNSNTKKITFEVTIYTIHQVHYDFYNFGSLTWTDGTHVVRSPISVKTKVEPLFDY